MSTVRNVSHLISLLTLRSEIIHTLDEAKAQPLAEPYVPIFEGLRDGWVVVFSEELGLRDGLSSAHARVYSVVLTLDDVAGRTSKAVLDLTKDNRTHPLYVAYFKKRTVSQFKRLRLELKLDAMRGWIGELTASNVPALVAISPEVAAAVAAMDEALKTRDGLAAQVTFFREVGNRKKFFDKVNATRKQTHGELARMPHEHLGLPMNFAGRFFRRDSTAADTGEKEPTLESIDETLTRIDQEATEQLELRQTLVAALAKAAAEAVAEAATPDPKQIAVAKLQKEQAAMAQKMAALQAKIAAALEG